MASQMHIGPQTCLFALAILGISQFAPAPASAQDQLPEAEVQEEQGGADQPSTIPTFEDFNPSDALNLEALQRSQGVQEATLASAPVTQENVAFMLKYNDGYVENMVVQYRGTLESSRWETGHPAKPLEGDFVDTRQCHWSINTYVKRDICTVSRSVGESCRGEWTEVFFIKGGGSGEPMSWTRIRGENCGDAGSWIDQQVAEARQALISQSTSITTTDLDKVEEMFRNSPDVVEVNRQ